MTGSRKNFGYESDNGKKYGVRLDKSVYETDALGMGDPPTDKRDLITVSGRVPVRPRYVLGFQKDNPIIKRKFWVGTAAAMRDLAEDGEVTIDGETYTLTGYVGEAGSLVTDTDTGQTT